MGRIGYPVAGAPAGTGFTTAWDSNVGVSMGALQLAGNSRAYLTDPRGRYVKLDLRGKTLRFTVDASNVPCSCNAALYFVSMTGPYCDIQSTPACTEIDLFEGNQAAIQATVHTKTGLGGDGSCNQWGCTVNWGNCKAVGLELPRSLAGFSPA